MPCLRAAQCLHTHKKFDIVVGNETLSLFFSLQYNSMVCSFKDVNTFHLLTCVNMQTMAFASFHVKKIFFESL